MPKYSKSLQQYYISRIRRLLVLKPDISIREIAETIQIDKDYANKLVNKIRREQIKRADKKTLSIALAKFEDLMSVGDREMWLIIQNENSSASEKIRAWENIRKNNMALFQMLFDAGVFERQLGKLKTEEQPLNEEEKKKLEILIANVFKIDKGTNIGSGK